MWSASIALNNLLSGGAPGDWATHMRARDINGEAVARILRVRA
jgi:alcohol dehydrogenase YqhD (iron-dependent ADH family)